MMTRTEASRAYQPHRGISSSRQVQAESQSVISPQTGRRKHGRRYSPVAIQHSSTRTSNQAPRKAEPSLFSRFVSFMSGVFHPMPAVQNVEMQEAQQPWPILRPKAKDIGPRAHALIHEGRLDCQPPLKIRFEEPPETVCLLDGDEVQLSRRSYTDLQIAQVELEKHMQQLKRRISRFPQGDVRDFVNEALHTYEKAQSERKRLFSSVSTLLRNAESAYQAKSRKELDDQVFQLGASLRSASRSLKVAQEEMGYAELPADANLEATRDCLTRYDNILEELLLKQDAPKETSESKDNESLV